MLTILLYAEKLYKYNNFMVYVGLIHVISGIIEMRIQH